MFKLGAQPVGAFLALRLGQNLFVFLAVRKLLLFTPMSEASWLSLLSQPPCCSVAHCTRMCRIWEGPAGMIAW